MLLMLLGCLLLSVAVSGREPTCRGRHDLELVDVYKVLHLFQNEFTAKMEQEKANLTAHVQTLQTMMQSQFETKLVEEAKKREELEKELKQIKGYISKTNEDFNRDLSTINNFTSALNKSLSITKDDVSSVNESLSITKDDVSSFNESLPLIKDDVSSFNESLSIINIAVATINKRIKGYISKTNDRDLSTINNFTSAINKSLSIIKHDVSSFNESLSITKDDVATINKRIKEYTGDSSKINNFTSALNESLTITKEAVEANTRALSSTKNDVAANTRALSLTKNDVAAIQKWGNDNRQSGILLFYGQPVCDDYFDTPDAVVACRMRGYDNVKSYKISQSIGRTDFIIRWLECTGTESSLWDCPHTVYNGGCSASEGVYLECN